MFFSENRAPGILDSKPSGGGGEGVENWVVLVLGPCDLAGSATATTVADPGSIPGAAYFGGGLAAYRGKVCSFPSSYPELRPGKG